MRQLRLVLLSLVASVVVVGMVAASSSGGGMSAPGSSAGQQQPAGRSVPGELIVHFREGIPQAWQAAVASINGVRLERRLLSGRHATVSVPVGDEEEFRAQLARDPAVEFVEPNLIRTTLTHDDPDAPDDPFFSFQWHLPMIQIEEAWDISQGTGVTVAVLDTGIAYEEFSIYGQAPDLADTSFVSPRDFVNGDSHANDDNGHGTHVAGTIAQNTNNGIGVAGVAFGATIMPVKVMDVDGIGTAADVADGVLWAVNNGADVINLSLGGPDISRAERQAFQVAEAFGVVVVAAAGNGDEQGVGEPVLLYPAALPSVISVGAVGYDETRASYSNYGLGEDGTILDLMAPGGDFVDLNEDTFVDGVLQNTYLHFCGAPSDPPDFTNFLYCFSIGTSMAAAHVTGVAALLLSADPSLTPNQVREVLTCSALDLGPPGVDMEYGSGLVQAFDALLDSDGDGVVDCLDTTSTPTPTPTPTPVAATSGDADCDGDVDSVDALQNLRFVADVKPFADCIDAGDVDCSGDVDTADALMILRYVAALPVDLPDGCPGIE